MQRLCKCSCFKYTAIFYAAVLVYTRKTSGLRIFCVALGGGKIKVGKFTMEAASFFETSVNIYQMTNQCIREAENLYIHRGENLRT
jgi:hypothetical protein